MPRSMIQRARLQGLTERFHEAAVLVIGDVMIDEYIWGKVSRISPEAPVPILDMVSESQKLGGSANVVNNLYALGGKPYLCSVIGDDTTGIQLREALQTLGVNTDTLLVDSTRPTTRKTRLIAHHQQVARLDRECRDAISREYTEQITEAAIAMLPHIDAIIIEDYGKGVVTADLVHKIVTTAAQQGKIVAVDPKTSHFDRYNGVSVITPNHYEAAASLNMTINSHDRLLLAGKQLVERLQSDYVLITRGGEGMSLFERQSGIVTHVPTMAQEVYDVSGAGDTVIAAFTLSLAVGANPVDAVLLSNAAAGVVVGKVGTAVSNPEELWGIVQKMNARDLNIQREAFE
ncbi:D-glycero-beta-D-manno-heptose-7-phosphate kinase [candidate division KSB3 bacterium]|uniref:D-glycero-beta-D-manno-heptose-7-phosphate kinase n=1 Tax=candidate division KSB3 bacterium TaxID=2044937 RepID=A0A2G6EDY2_9BACT|nr:MAG: D-glycero-beta-D-manno-heptose-7-phosphate kinase [candidate division KSB3 bacterium]PIE31075.1 MAG: D-glycero-beta-D-manno-heptose-7-phosphate kinase [candidate division KSB3 bacterium]